MSLVRLCYTSLVSYYVICKVFTSVARYNVRRRALGQAVCGAVILRPVRSPLIIIIFYISKNGFSCLSSVALMSDDDCAFLDNPPATPRMARCLAECRTSLSTEAIGQANLVGPWSINDAFAMEVSAFVSEIAGARVIALAKELALRREHKQPVSKAGSSAVQSGVALQGPLFNESKKRLKPYEFGSGDKQITGKTLARTKHEAVVDSLVSMMDDDIRAALYDGIREVPSDIQVVLVRKAVDNAAGSDQLRSARDALVRLRSWYSKKFGVFRGFYMREAIIGWFLLDNMIDDDWDGHAPQSLVSGLRFASAKLKFPFCVSSAPMRSLSKGSTKTEKQAPSASVRLVYHFWEVASTLSLPMAVRGASAVFLVMCLAALRGIDAQRSAFDSEFARENKRYRYFTGVAWDSKRRRSMPWACPVVVFGGSEWFDALRFIWKDRDYMFPSVASGVKLADVRDFEARPASAFIVLRYLREILQLPTVSLSAEEAKWLRRHSFRHWIANAIRILKFGLPDAFQAGRWKDSAVMPLRYALETKFVVMVDIVVRVLDECYAALQRVPAARWPIFGGWELLLGDDGLIAGESCESPELVVCPGESDDDDEDSADEDCESSSVREPPIAPARGKKALPAGWTRTEQRFSSGRTIPHFYGPNGEYARSVVGAWRVHGVCDSALAGMDVPSAEVNPKLSTDTVGQRVDVYWTEEFKWFAADVLSVDGTCFSLLYDDGEKHTHDTTEVRWRYPVGDAGVAAASAGGSSDAVCVLAAADEEDVSVGFESILDDVISGFTADIAREVFPRAVGLSPSVSDRPLDGEECVAVPVAPAKRYEVREFDEHQCPVFFGGLQCVVWCPRNGEHKGAHEFPDVGRSRRRSF